MTATISTATTDLDEALGDPFCPANPHGATAILAADERAERAVATYELLSDHGLQRMFVPAELGGDLVAIPSLVHALAPVFGRDMGLGLGFGVTTLMAALNVWHSGDDRQRHQVADQVLTGGPLSVAYHELDHGNDMAANEVRADAAIGGYRLSGRKEVINNADRASTAVVFARTSDRPGRSHSLFLVDLDNVRRLDRFRTTALRTAHLGGLEFTDHPVPAEDRIGADGHGIEIALKSFQVSRVVMAGAGLGPVDIALHLAASFAGQRVVYGRRVDQIPHARTNLAIAQSLLLAVEAAVIAAAMGLHTAPRHAGAQAASVKYAAPLLLEYAMEHLAVVLGARFYLRTGPFALFGKHYRDLAPVGIGHAGSTSCLLALLPQVRHLLQAVPAATLPAWTDRLPRLDFSQLVLRSGAPDPIVSWTPAATPLPAAAGAGDLIEEQARTLERLRSAAEAMPASALGVTAPPAAFDVTEQFTKRFVIGAALAARESDRTEFADAWVRIAIAAVTAHRRGRAVVDPDDVDVVMQRIDRHVTSSRSLLLDGHNVPRSIPAL
jgi:alkylation response protein AidB-like acyl-CoA dehydrogenase